MTFGFISPFEYFRTPLFIERHTQGFYYYGIWQDGSQVFLGSDFVVGNIINITLNGIALSAIHFTIDQSTTMGLIKTALLSQQNIQYVDITNSNLTLSVIPLEPNLSIINSFVITGGLTQPTITITNSPEFINTTASVQPFKGIQVELLPEGRNDKETYEMYTSTEIYGITTQNPDQVTVLKGPFTGLVFEVLQIDDWQNNSNFNIVNHYHYLA